MSKFKQNTPATLPRLFSIKQLAEHTGLGRTTISTALSSGHLEHYRMGSRAVIPESAVIDWLEAHRVGRRCRLFRKPKLGGEAPADNE